MKDLAGNIGTTITPDKKTGDNFFIGNENTIDKSHS